MFPSNKHQGWTENKCSLLSCKCCLSSCGTPGTEGFVCTCNKHRIKMKVQEFTKGLKIINLRVYQSKMFLCFLYTESKIWFLIKTSTGWILAYYLSVVYRSITNCGYDLHKYPSCQCDSSKPITGLIWIFGTLVEISLIFLMQTINHKTDPEDEREKLQFYLLPVITPWHSSVIYIAPLHNRSQRTLSI